MGNVIHELDMSKFYQVAEKANEICEKEGERLENIEGCPSFTFMSGAKTILDILDPIIGLIPGIGDTISAAASAPSLYFAAVEAKSLKLTMAVLYYTIVDWLAGLIPVIGDIADFLYMSHRKTYRICLGFIHDDPEANKEIDRAATSLVVLLIILGALLYFAYEMIMKIVEWYSSLM